MRGDMGRTNLVILCSVSEGWFVNTILKSCKTQWRLVNQYDFVEISVLLVFKLCLQVTLYRLSTAEMSRNSG